ncbi:hypothetical protein [Leisingera sp. ANG-DT]|uniref:hypothetical protein n=1 Tax=Leisingera sp. ANG-DT TaxID=1577897 RepID=UPI00057C7B22|nr:hypothetical protein [Leisingera sp. ANG-DT]KIC16762.1 hypothetical protein RA21_11160 [Leisingera sp. ANG-DT]
MLEAQRLWPYRPRLFAKAFRYQYVVSRQVEQIHSFARRTCGQWHIHSGKDLPACTLHDAQGRQFGVLLGIAVGPAGLLSGPQQHLPLDSTAADFWNHLEAFITDTAGRFAIIAESGGQARFYTDPVAMIGAVYDPLARRVAASPLLALDRPVVPNPKVDLDTVENHGGKISLFHTADKHVRRLNPNCYLDLRTFREHRFWPRENDSLDAPADPVEIYDRIYAQASFNIGAIAAAHPTALPVTGGQDSRLLMTFAKPHAGRIRHYFSHINNYATRRDAAIGGILCQRLNLRHEPLDKRDFSLPEAEVEKRRSIYHLTTGAPMPPPLEHLNGTANGLPENTVILRGHQTDLLRAVFVTRPQGLWDVINWQIRKLLIVPSNMFGPETAALFRDDFTAWQQSLNTPARSKAVDFLFLEVYYSSTIGAVFPGLWQHFYMSPFNSRKLIALSLSFADKHRVESEPVFDIIERFAPQLSDVPFDFEAPADLDALHGCEGSYGPMTRARRLAAIKRLTRALPEQASQTRPEEEQPAAAAGTA